MNVQFNSTNLRIARLAQDLSIAELGDLTGKSRQYIARIETGIDLPSSTMVDCLSENLDVAPDFFYNQTGRQLDDNVFHFRKLATTKNVDKLSAIAKVELFSRFFGTI